MGGAVVLLLIGVGVIAATHEPETEEPAPVAEPIEPVAIPEPPPTCLDRVAERARVEADLSSTWERRVYFVDGRPCVRGAP